MGGKKAAAKGTIEGTVLELASPLKPFQQNAIHMERVKKAWESIISHPVFADVPTAAPLGIGNIPDELAFPGIGSQAGPYVS